MSGTPPVKNANQVRRYFVSIGEHLGLLLRRLSAALPSESGDGQRNNQHALAPGPSFPPGSKLPPLERAKLDYQSHLNKQEVRADNCSKLWQIFLDKGVLTVAGILIVFCFNSCQENRRREETHNLERYKLDEARQRFFVEKRLDAMLNLSTVMSDVTRVYFTYTGSKKDAPEKEAEKEYEKALASAREVINRNAILFGKGFNANMDRYYEVHRAIMCVGVTKCAEYQDFVADLSTQFDEVCQAILQKLEKTQNEKIGEAPQLTLAPIPFEKRVRMPPKEYLDKHFNYWKAHKSAKR